MKKSFLNIQAFVERPMSIIGRDKYTKFLSENEGKILKMSDIGIVPIVDNSREIISWELPIDPETTKVKERIHEIDFGETFGKLRLPIIEYENEEIQANGTKKVKKGFSFQNVDKNVITRFLAASFELLSMVHEFEPQHRGLLKEFRHIGHLVKDSEGFPLMGYAFLETYHGITKNPDPIIQKNIQALSDVKRFTYGNMRFYIEGKRQFYKYMEEALQSGDLKKMFSDEKDMYDLVGKDDFVIVDKDTLDVSKMYPGGVTETNVANRFSTGGIVQLDSMIASGLQIDTLGGNTYTGPVANKGATTAASAPGGTPANTGAAQGTKASIKVKK